LVANTISSGTNENRYSAFSRAIASVSPSTTVVDVQIAQSAGARPNRAIRSLMSV
jgi:hypothetical protein